MDNRKFADLIIERRKYLNLTQKDLAQKLNVTDKAISKWERGKSLPDISLLSKIADILGISLLELMNEEASAISDKSKTAPNIISPDNQKKSWFSLSRNSWIAIAVVLIIVLSLGLLRKPKEQFPEPIDDMMVSAGFYAFEGHDGIDIVNTEMISGNATELYSIAKGMISDFGESLHDGFFIKIDYTDFQVIYSHLDNLNGITRRNVEKGDVILLTGKESSGNNTGPHIEMQVIVQDKIVDPIKYLNYQ